MIDNATEFVREEVFSPPAPTRMISPEGLKSWLSLHRRRLVAGVTAVIDDVRSRRLSLRLCDRIKGGSDAASGVGDSATALRPPAASSFRRLPLLAFAPAADAQP